MYGYRPRPAADDGRQPCKPGSAAIQTTCSGVEHSILCIQGTWSFRFFYNMNVIAAGGTTSDLINQVNADFTSYFNLGSRVQQYRISRLLL